MTGVSFQTVASSCGNSGAKHTKHVLKQHNDQIPVRPPRERNRRQWGCRANTGPEHQSRRKPSATVVQPWRCHPVTKTGLAA
eukprot:4311123-Lingulodinium_polyedra.AAC.1